MKRDSAAESIDSVEIDWNKARRFIRSCLVRKLHGLDEHDLEDLVQDATVRLIRAIRREGAHNPKGLMTTIAYRTAIDFIRSRRRTSSLFDRLDGRSCKHPADWTAQPDVPCDSSRRVKFFVLEFFRSSKGSCYDLAEAFFERRNWPSVARELSISHDAVRARWSRCVDTLRRAVNADGTFTLLNEWARG